MGQVYNPKLVTATWRNINLLSGISEGTFITATRNKKSMSMSEGGDDEYTMVRVPGKGGVISITYRMGAPIIKTLNDLARSDENRSDGFINAGDLYIEDFSGTSVCQGINAVLEGVIDYEAATDEGDVTVTWLCKLELRTGGSSDITAFTTAP